MQAGDGDTTLSVEVLQDTFYEGGDPEGEKGVGAIIQIWPFVQCIYNQLRPRVGAITI